MFNWQPTQNQSVKSNSEQFPRADFPHFDRMGTKLHLVAQMTEEEQQKNDSKAKFHRSVDYASLCGPFASLKLLRGWICYTFHSEFSEFSLPQRSSYSQSSNWLTCCRWRDTTSNRRDNGLVVVKKEMYFWHGSLVKKLNDGRRECGFDCGRWSRCYFVTV